MIAVRLMTRECARLIVEESTEESIANDVAWPLLAHSHGMRLAYVGVDGLAYRFRDDFGATADARDDDPVEWIRRLEIAAQHATSMRPFLQPRRSGAEGGDGGSCESVRGSAVRR